MPNWCSNSAIVYGSKDDVEKFKFNLTLAQHYGSKDGHWGTYELFFVHGYTNDFILKDPSSGYVRGNIIDVNDIDDLGDGLFALSFFFESAWGPMIDGLRKICSEKYENLKCEILAEECGNEVYINTDTSGKFFSEKYCVDDPDAGIEYFDNDAQLIKYVKDTFNYDIKDVSQLADDDVIDYADDKSFNFHRFANY